MIPAMSFTRKIVQFSTSMIRNGVRQCSTSAPAQGKKVVEVPISDFEKKILVWSKVYKTLGEVPNRVSVGKMKKGKDWFRIRVSVGMIIMTSVASVAMIISGKMAHEHGHSVEEYNREWHKQVKEGGDIHTKPVVLPMKE